MISIQQMYYILVLSEELHFQRASERCFVTQPTLSMQLKKAEETLETLIFDRSRSPLELTNFGNELLPIIRDTLNEHSKIAELYSKSKGTYREEIKVGIIPTVAGYVLPDLYSTWKKELSNVHLIIEELKTEEILLALDQKRIDLGILAGPVHDPRLRSVPLYNEEIKVYYPNGEGKKISINELKQIDPWLLTTGNCLRTQMMNFCELKESTSDSWDYEGGNIELLQRMVQQHGGYTLVPENYIDNSSNDYKTVSSNRGEIPAREIIALSSNRTTKWKNIERLIRTIQFKYYKQEQENFQLLNWQ